MISYLEVSNRDHLVASDNLVINAGPKKGIPSFAAVRLQRRALLLLAYQYTTVNPEIFGVKIFSDTSKNPKIKNTKIFLLRNFKTISVF